MAVMTILTVPPDYCTITCHGLHAEVGSGMTVTCATSGQKTYARVTAVNGYEFTVKRASLPEMIIDSVKKLYCDLKWKVRGLARKRYAAIQSKT